MNPILEQALALHAAGISVLPVKRDGSKSPAAGACRTPGNWKEYQTAPATIEELHAWFGQERYALGIITGDISGRLEMAEVEGRAAHRIQEIQQTAYDNGLGPVWEKICGGWLEESPSGGMHWFYRLTETPAGNTKLARRPATPEELAENPKEKWKVLAETRGEGGFVVVAPSGGTTHETGRPWEVIVGGPQTIPSVTPEENEQIHALLASINEEPPAPEAPARSSAPSAAGGMFGAVSPGDDYEAKTDWKDILVPNGWRFAFQAGHTRYWTRPGKTHGISATTGRDPARDRLFVMSSSTDFEDWTPYTKFGAYTHLEHGGDHSAAATALRRQGFGKDPEIGTSTWTPTSSPSPFAQPATATATTTSSSATSTAPSSEPAPPPPPAPSATAPAAWDQWSNPSAPPSDTAITSHEGTSVEGNLATVTELRPRTGRTIAHTDDGNAQLLINVYGRELRYNPDRGRWLHWTGAVWEYQAGGGGAVRELAKETIRGIQPDGDADRTWKKKSLSASAITNMLIQAQTDPRVVVNARDLDARPWELNTPAGIINLRTAALEPSNPESLHTKLTGVAPNFDTPSALFDGFRADTFQGDQEKEDYVQRALGYSAVGLVREHLLLLATGTGGNGKGVLFETVKNVLGDYATSAPAGFLLKTQFQSHPTDLAALQGARFVLQSEVNHDDVFDEGKVKRLSGGDSVTARFMRQDNFTFAPTHQIWIMANNRPAVEAGGRAFWRRARIVPFTNEVPEDRIVVDLQNLLSDDEHGPAVLAWIAQGAAAYYQHGLKEPAAVRAATEDYKHEVDTVGRWLEAEAIVDEHPNPLTSPTTACNAIINSYEKWCRQEGAPALKGRAFQNALADQGIITGSGVPKNHYGQRQYQGITLNSAPGQHFAPDDGGSPFAAGQGRAW